MLEFLNEKTLNAFNLFEEEILHGINYPNIRLYYEESHLDNLVRTFINFLSYSHIGIWLPLDSTELIQLSLHYVGSTVVSQLTIYMDGGTTP